MTYNAFSLLVTESSDTEPQRVTLKLFEVSEPETKSVEATTLIATMLIGDDENYGMGALMLIRSIQRRTTLLSRMDFRIVEIH